MSEQTPDSTANARDDDGFAAAEAEPSMEDILASIRKIISDDADPLPLDGPEVAFLPTPTVVEPAAETPGDDAFDLDSLLGELGETDVSDPEPQSFSDESLAGALGFDDLDDIAIPEIEADAAVIEAAEIEDDMDQLMNELLVDMEMPSSDARLESVIAASPVATPAVSAASDDEDMDIVKSLMAGLTDEDLDPSLGSTASGEIDLDAMMDELAGFDDEVDTAFEETPASDTTAESDLDELDAMEEDIFDSILEMTLDDEIEAFDAQSEVDVAVPSLAAIAAEAEADATPTAVVQSASVLGAELVNAQTSDAKSDESETEQTTAEMTDDATRLAPAQPDPSEMEIPMPRALRSDAILDDVTESATMSAFAELNQVVEDKAILSERGPRIGDLVQDALKPMLKEWLDANIQGIVERAVAKEVQRIASGK